MYSEILDINQDFLQQDNNNNDNKSDTEMDSDILDINQDFLRQPYDTSNVTPLSCFNIQKMRKYGNCFYEAVALQLHRISTSREKLSSHELRIMANKWLADHQNTHICYDFEGIRDPICAYTDNFPTLKIPGEPNQQVTWDQYLAHSSKSGIYAEEPQLQAIADLLAVRICAHSSLQDSMIICPIFMPFTDTIYLYFTPGEEKHYDNLIPNRYTSYSRSNDAVAVNSSATNTSTHTPYHVSLPTPTTKLVVQEHPGLRYSTQHIYDIYGHVKHLQSAVSSDTMHIDSTSNVTSDPSTSDVTNLASSSINFNNALMAPPSKARVSFSTGQPSGGSLSFTKHRLKHGSTNPPLPITPNLSTDSRKIQEEITKEAIGYERIEQAVYTYPPLINIIPPVYRDYIDSFVEKLENIAEKPFSSMYATVTGIPGKKALQNATIKSNTISELNYLVSQLGKYDSLQSSENNTYDSGIEINWEDSMCNTEFRYVERTNTSTIVLLFKTPTRAAQSSVPNKHVFSIFNKVQGAPRGTWSDAQIQQESQDNQQENQDNSQSDTKNSKKTKPQRLPQVVRNYTIQFIPPNIDMNHLMSGTPIMVFRGIGHSPDSFFNNSLLSLQQSLVNSSVSTDQYAILVDKVYHKWKRTSKQKTPTVTPELVFSVFLLHQPKDVENTNSTSHRQQNILREKVGLSSNPCTLWQYAGHKFEGIINYERATYESNDSFIPHSTYLLGGTNVSYITLPDDSSITGTQIVHDLLLLKKTAHLFYPLISGHIASPAPIQNVFIQTSDPFSEDLTLRNTRTCVILWYEDRQLFEPSGLGPIYESYYTGDHAWLPRVIEFSPSGYDSFKLQISEVLQYHSRSRPNFNTSSPPPVVTSSQPSVIVPKVVRLDTTSLSQSPIHKSSYSTAVSKTTSSLPSTEVVHHSNQDPELRLLSKQFQDILSKVSIIEDNYDNLSTKVENLSEKQSTLQSSVVDLSQGQSSLKSEIATLSQGQTAGFNNVTNILERLLLQSSTHLPDGHGASSGR